MRETRQSGSEGGGPAPKPGLPTPIQALVRRLFFSIRHHAHRVASAKKSSSVHELPLLTDRSGRTIATLPSPATLGVLTLNDCCLERTAFRCGRTLILLSAVQALNRVPALYAHATEQAFLATLGRIAVVASFTGEKPQNACSAAGIGTSAECIAVIGST